MDKGKTAGESKVRICLINDQSGKTKILHTGAEAWACVEVAIYAGSEEPAPPN
jgi:hypothetical protein